MSAPLLRVQSLSSGYGQGDIVHDVSFDIQPGQIFGLIGLNGAGKTTLIKTILGLRDKSKGDVSYKKEDVSYLPERFDPPWFLTGYNFIRFSLSLYGKKIDHEDAYKAADQLSLDPNALKRNVSTYSKGMRQKLGLLATILTDSPLIILDEPMSGLDPKARLEVKYMIQKAKSQGRSIFMSSHILADIDELCDQVAVFHNNRIIFNGTPAALHEKGGKESLEQAFMTVIGQE